jgi:alanine racemase
MIQLPNSVKIDLSALEHNLNQVKKLVNPKTQIMGIVKSDAYGHGLLPVSQVLERNGIDRLGVGYLQEALELRKSGVRLPLAVLCGIKAREEAKEVVDKDLTPALYDLATAEILAEEAARRGKRIHIQLKVDTGMGRLGIPHSKVEPFIKKIREYKELNLEALTSHLSSADETNSEFTKDQIKNFEKAIKMGRAMGLELPLNNLANSAGIMAHKDSHFGMVRPGIMLYGGLPSPGFRSPTPLKPVMNFTGRILQIKDLPDHSPVSYGRTYYTKGSQRIAVLSAGYGDGLPRSLSNRGKVLIGGKKVNVIGRICMNMTVTDITGLNEVVPGNEVVFFGSQGDEIITGDDVAEWGETISYEIFCSVGQGNTRQYTQ